MNLYNIVAKLEENKKTEEEIVLELKKIMDSSKNKNIIYKINDCLFHKGYSYQFKPLEVAKLQFNNSDYYNIVSNATKSKQKTNELLSYISEVDDFRLTLNAMNFIKIKNLVALGLFDDTVYYIRDNLNDSLYEFYMKLFKVENNELSFFKWELEDWLKNIGLRWLECNYMQFRMDMEYLLFTILKNKNDYLKLNTIKVAFSICPREYLINGDKLYYNKNIHKSLISYLALIDKTEIKRMKDKYNNIIDKFDDTGYKLLYNML